MRWSRRYRDGTKKEGRKEQVIKGRKKCNKDEEMMEETKMGGVLKDGRAK